MPAIKRFDAKMCESICCSLQRNAAECEETSVALEEEESRDKLTDAKHICPSSARLWLAEADQTRFKNYFKYGASNSNGCVCANVCKAYVKKVPDVTIHLVHRTQTIKALAVLLTSWTSTFQKKYRRMWKARAKEKNRLFN